MRLIKKYFYCICIFSISAHCVASETSKISLFDTYCLFSLADACSLKSENESAIGELMDLHELDSRSADLLCRFWKKKAFMHYKKEIEHEISLSFQQFNISGKTKEENEKIKNDGINNIALIVSIYYYDHWDEIKGMIHRKLEEVKKKKKIKYSSDKPTGFIEKLKSFFGLDSKN